MLTRLQVQLVLQKIEPAMIWVLNLRIQVEVKYTQALALSTAYQGGIVAWVAFWAIYGHGFGAQNLAQVASFGAAYMTVIILEPLVDLAVLAIAKNASRLTDNALFQHRLHHAAA